MESSNQRLRHAVARHWLRQHVAPEGRPDFAKPAFPNPRTRSIWKRIIPAAISAAETGRRGCS